MLTQRQTLACVVRLQREAETSPVSQTGDEVPPFLKSPQARAARCIKITPQVSSDRAGC